MAGLDPTTQRAHVHAPKIWMAGLEAGYGEIEK
jgi:hypothetical protein